MLSDNRQLARLRIGGPKLAALPLPLHFIEDQHSTLGMPHRVENPNRPRQVAAHLLTDVGQYLGLAGVQIMPLWRHLVEGGSYCFS